MKSASSSWRAWAIVSFFALIAVGWMTFVDDRPFWVVTTDPEQDYYFNSRAILETGFPESVRHPGTPAYYLGALVMLTSGSDTASAQLFFNLTYLLAVLIFIGATAVFTRKALVGVPFAPSLLILSSLLLWPPFLTYSNYYSVESFLFSASLLVSAYVAPLVLRSFSWSVKPAVALGVALGMAAGLKFTVAPVGVAIGMMVVVGVWMGNRELEVLRRSQLALRYLIVLFGAAAISFFVLILPVIRFFYEFIGRLRIELSRSGSGESGFSGIANFVRMAPETSILIVLILIVPIAVVVWQRAKGIGETSGSSGAAQINLTTSAALLSVLTLSGLFLARSLSDPSEAVYGDHGVLLRNLTPLAGFVPLGLLIAWRVCEQFLPDRSQVSSLQRISESGMVLLSAILVITSLFGYFSWRSESYQQIQESVAARQSELESLLPAGSRVAVWDSGVTFGEPMFFYWGNYRYAFDRFDEELLNQYPNHTMLRVREIGSLGGLADSSSGDGSTGADEGFLRGSAQEVYESFISGWKERFPRRSRTDEVLTGENSGKEIAAILYRPKNVAIITGEAESSEEAIQRVIESRFGSSERIQVEIGGETWSLVRLLAE